MVIVSPGEDAMRLHGWLCFVLLLSQVGVLRAADPVPLEAFAAAPQTTKVTISPGGGLLAWGATAGNDVHVVVFDATTQKYIRTFPIERERSLTGLGWVDDETLL